MKIDELFAGESDNVEYKEDVPSKSEKYMKTVVAFANGTGGRLIFGVEDGTWKVSGFAKEVVFEKMDAITNAIYDSCEPKITPNVALQELDDKVIIVVDILSGMQKPYYIRSQGMLDGVYVRVAGTTRCAERYRVQELILEGTNRSFDQIETENIVTEDEISAFCEKMYHHALELRASEEEKTQIQRVGRNQLLSWKLLVQKNDKYYPTKGYLLLDGQTDEFPEAVIQCAVFKGTVRDIFITRKEFGGPIYQQIEDAYHFVLQHIDLGSRIEGIARQDFYELPVKTIREMISNAVCHRSYLTPGKIQVALFDDRLEVTSPGMLDNELTIEKLKSGFSKVKNKGIAAAFSYMNIIEAWGSGIPKMFRDAASYGLPEPELFDMGSDFRVNLYRKQAVTDYLGVVNPKEASLNETNGTDTVSIATTAKTAAKATVKLPIALTPTEKKIISNIQENPYITQEELGENVGLSVDGVRYVIRQLKAKGVLRREGSNRHGMWQILVQ